MNIKTLREVCNTLDISRRAIQGYEKAGLVSPCGKNERGYLLYDEEAQKRIEEIRLYQQIGFTRKEISNIIDAPDDVWRQALERQLVRLREEEKNIETLIEKVYRLLEKK